MKYFLYRQRLNIFVFFSILLSLFLPTPVEGKSKPELSTAQLAQYNAFAIAQNIEEESSETEEKEESPDERIIFLSGTITYETASSVVSKLLSLDEENPDEDIYIYINSPGGSVYAGMAIYDAIQYVQADVVTVSVGFSASMGAFLLAAGTPGKRFAFPHSRVMIHKPFGGAFGEAADLEIRASESRYITNQFYRLFSAHTGQSISKLRRDMDRDYYMGASEALEYGIVDQIFERDSASEDQVIF